MGTRTGAIGLFATVVAVVAIAAAVVFAPLQDAVDGQGAGTRTLDRAEALAELEEVLEDVDQREEVVTHSGAIQVGRAKDLGESVPDVDTFPWAVAPTRGCETVVVMASTEKSGTGADGWMTQEVESFNKGARRGTPCTEVALRKIASGIAYEMLAAGKGEAQGYSPSNALWTAMLEARGVEVRTVLPETVRNLGGIVMKPETAQELRAAAAGGSMVESLIDRVVEGRLAMGYTNPYRSSTGLNLLATVLLTASGGDVGTMTAPAAASAFQSFQKGVPFNAETTLQIRDSVRGDGSLGAFVMESQTFEGLKADAPEYASYEFIPFGVVHANPLVGIGPLSKQQLEVLEAFGRHLRGAKAQERAKALGFNPTLQYTPPWPVPDGAKLIEAQRLWKEGKDAGRTRVAVFVADTSGSMEGARLEGLKRALSEAVRFMGPGNEIGLVEFNTVVRVRRPVGRMDKDNGRGLFLGAVDALESGGGTQMYDAVAVGMDMAIKAAGGDPARRPSVFVLSDGDSKGGVSAKRVRRLVQALKVPVYTIAYGGDVGTRALRELAGEAEAASIKVGEDDVVHRLSHLFNSQL